MIQTAPTQSFQTLHSPRCANAHFALGMVGAGGGFGLQSSRVAQQNVFIGYRQGHDLHTLPFYANAFSDELPTFLGEQSQQSPYKVNPIPAEQITRSQGWGTDKWAAPGVEFTLYSPGSGVPDPETTPFPSSKAPSRQLFPPDSLLKTRVAQNPFRVT